MDSLPRGSILFARIGKTLKIWRRLEEGKRPG